MSDTRCHTFTHQGFDPFHPRAEDVRLEDIAHGLAMICRYGGQAPVFYSVAEHAVKVSRLVGAVTGRVGWALHALHHDSAEAYIGDQRKPLKDHLAFDVPEDWLRFDELENLIADAIFLGLKLPMIGDDTGETDDISACRDMDDAIHDADLSLLHAEMAAFWGRANAAPAPWTTKIYQRECLDWERAEGLFLSEHARLKAGRLWRG